MDEVAAMLLLNIKQPGTHLLPRNFFTASVCSLVCWFWFDRFVNKVIM